MKILTLENKHELMPFIQAADYNEYNSNIVTMLMWANMYEVHYEIYEHYAIAYTMMPHRPPIWMMPYCAKEFRRDAIDKIKQRSAELSIAFEIHSMTSEFKNWLQATYCDEFLVWDCYNARDYVYDRTQQETLVGKKMQKRRNHYHAFEKEYANRYLYKKLTTDDFPAIYAFLQEWKLNKEQDASIDAEEAGIHLLLTNLDTLPIQGGCIYIDGKLEAFNITSRLSKDTIQIHVEKANRQMRGLYIAILKLFLETLDKEILFINREDDLGLEELRKAKKDMQPISKTKKFGCCFQKLEIMKANVAYLPQIIALWKERFSDENEQSTEYYFQHLFNFQDCYILVSNSELITMLQARKMDIMMNDQPERVSFLVGITTSSEYEGCGYMRRLMEYVLEELKPQEKMILLQAYNCEIYTPFGFTQAYQLTKTKLDKSAYTHTNGVVTSQFTTNELLNIYQSYTKDKNGYRIRDVEYYEVQLDYKKVWDEKFYVHCTNQERDAYVLIHETDTEIHINECIYKDEQALQSMLAWICKTEKTVYVNCDSNTSLHGRKKPYNAMMMKELQANIWQQDSLFINEEI